MFNVRKRLGVMVLLAIASVACASNNDNAHTTVTTFVSPPPRQVLRVESRPSKQIVATGDEVIDPKKPLLIFNLVNGKVFHEGEEVVIDFSLANAKLKGDGGEYRVRYIVDDEDMKWIDHWEQIVLTGWTPGKHTIRLELIGPDGWPYRNGDYNIVTRELTVVK